MFDPFDLLTVEVRHRGTSTEPAPTTGIDYARLIEAAHHAGLARQVNYAALATRGVAPGAADITEDVVVNVDDVVTGHGDEQEKAR